MSDVVMAYARPSQLVAHPSNGQHVLDLVPATGLMTVESFSARLKPPRNTLRPTTQILHHSSDIHPQCFDIVGH